jgi:hypothetical protein
VDIGKVRLEQPVKVSLDAYPKVRFAGVIKRIAPAARLEEKVKVFDVEDRHRPAGGGAAHGDDGQRGRHGRAQGQGAHRPVEALFR